MPFNGRAGYNFYPDMQNPRYALVAYVKNPVGEFVETLRRELHPDLPHLAAHLTILPPRNLRGTESAAVQTLEQVCALTEPFAVSLGDMETFLPDTPTVYIRVTHAAQRMCELHHQLNIKALAFDEEWPYVPHLTVVKMATQLPAKHAFRVASERWLRYSGERRILLESLTFVREEEPDRWVDLAPVRLGRRLVSPEPRG
jgi:2'-5' RNA ligase